MPSTLTQSLASYLPPIVVRHAAASSTLSLAPSLEHLEAAVLSADISGFTPLAEALAQSGPSGAEALTRRLNDYLGQIVELIALHGGEVLSFAGDAVIAMWSGATTGENLSQLTHRAAFCGLRIQTQLNDYQPAEGVQLHLRIGISSGTVKALHIGGVDNCWKFLLAGDPITGMCHAEAIAQPGDVVLDYAAWQLLGKTLEKNARSTALELGRRRLQDIESPPPIPSTASNTTTEDAGVDEAMARCYVPQSVLSRLEAEQPNWLAELRCVTVMFVNIKGLNYNSPAVLDQVQEAICSIQKTIAHFEGTISQTIVHSSDTVLIAAFGLPPRAHEDDAVRATQAALEIHAQLEQLGLAASIGITTGRAFCGPIGNDRRREYTMVGSVINLAARLMQVGSNQVLCDTATFQAAQSRVQFQALSAIAVKGKVDKVPVFRAHGRVGLELNASVQDSGFQAQTPFVGRQAEREMLVRSLDALDSGVSGVVLIEGEPGIGKSRLVEELLHQARSRGGAALMGAGDAIELSTPYHAWRAVFASIFGIAEMADLQTRRERVFDYFKSTAELADPHRLKLTPLLNAVLPLEFPENDLTSQMTGQVRADNTRDLLLRVLQALVRTTPSVLVIEDAHWLDSASWALLSLISGQVKPILLVVATRPLNEPVPVEYQQLLQAVSTELIQLEALPADSIEDLVCQRLGLTSLARPVVDFIRHKGQGNPFFTEELAYSLREAGLLLIEDGHGQSAAGVSLDSFMFPDSVQGIVTGRIDRLTPAQQLTLKVASVIGRVFAYRILRDIYPGNNEAAQLAAHLENLERLDITPLDTPEPNLTYLFKHVITREVSYNLMLFSQRRELHQLVAQWYEQTYHENLAPYYSLLAYHWNGAGDKAKTIEYCEKAGEQALHNAAYQEAIGFFTQTLTLDTLETQRPESVGAAADGAAAAETGPTANHLRRARWERQLGESLLGVGQLLESRRHLEIAAALLQAEVPIKQGQLALGVVSQVFQQLGNRLRPTRHNRVSAVAKDISLEAARSYERLATSYFLDNQMALTLFCSLRTLNLSETFGPSPELARAFGTAAISTSLVPLRRLSHFYDRRSIEVSQSADQLRASTWVRSISGLCSLNHGDLERARVSLGESIQMAEKLGNRRQWIEGTAMLTLSNHYAGRFEESAQQSAALYEAACRNGDIQAQIWGMAFHATNLLVLDQIEQAAVLVERAVALLDKNLGASVGRQEQMEVYGALSLLRLREGDLEAAREAADKTLDLLTESPPIAAVIFFSYANTATVYLALFAVAQQRKEFDKSLLRQTKRACVSLRKFARIFPIGIPYALMARGELAWLCAQPRSAMRSWDEALAAAVRLKMPYDQGKAHYEIGRHLPQTDSQHLSHLERASQIFEELGAVYDLKQTRMQTISRDLR